MTLCRVISNFMFPKTLFNPIEWVGEDQGGRSNVTGAIMALAGLAGSLAMVSGRMHNYHA